MANPKNLGDKQIFREDFRSAQAVADNGGVLTNATVADGVLTCSGGGADYSMPEMDSFWENGGTIRMIVQNDNVSGSKRVFNYTDDSATRSITFLRTLSSGSNFFQIRNGAGNNFYYVNIIDSQSTADLEMVMTWDPATTTVTGYVDGANATSDSSAGTQATTQDTTTHLVRAGGSAQSPWNGTFKLLEIYLGTVWTQEEVTDAYEDDTYDEVDFGRAIVHLPMITQYNDGSQKTVNKGTFSDSIVVGDGSTGTTYPTTIGTTPRSFSFDGGDYLKDSTADFQSGDSAGSISTWVKIDTLGTAHMIFCSSDEATNTSFIQFGISATGTALFRQINAGGTLYGIDGATTLGIGGWNHVVVTSSGTAWKMYVNGVEDTPYAVTVSNNGNWLADTTLRDNATWGVLDRTSQILFLDGQMKDGFVWDFELTDRQIRWIYQRGLKEFNI